MKTKFFVIVLCLSFAVLIAASVTLHAQEETYLPDEFYVMDPGFNPVHSSFIYRDLDPGFNPDHTSFIYRPSYDYASTQVFLIKDSLVNWSLTGSASTYYPMQMGVQGSGLYPTLNNYMGLGNYMQGLQFGSPVPIVAASGYPAFISNTYNVSVPSMGTQPPDMSRLNGLRDPMQVALPWQTMFETSVPGYKYDPTHPKKTSPIVSDTGPGGIGYIPGGIWGGRFSAAPLFPSYYDF